jgi:hypothetical protein
MLADVQPQRETRLADTLRQLFPRLRRRGVLLILSDFLVDDPEDLFAALRLYRSCFFEIILMHIVHPEEQTLPQGPAYRFEDLEDLGQVSCSPQEVVRAYERAFSNHQRTLSGLARAGGCEYRFVSTSLPYVLVLKDLLAERRG